MEPLALLAAIEANGKEIIAGKTQQAQSAQRIQELEALVQRLNERAAADAQRIAELESLVPKADVVRGASGS